MNIVNPEASYFEQEVIAADIKGLVPGAKRPPMGDLKSDLVVLSRTD